MAKEELNELSEMATAEISLVKKGANEKKRFPIFKSKELRMEMMDVMKAVLETEVDGEKDLPKIESEKGAAALVGIHRILKSFAAELPVEVVRGLVAEPEAVQEEEPKMSPEAEEIFKSQQMELAIVKKALEVETDKRVYAEWLEKAKTDLSHYPGKSSEELAKMLKDMPAEMAANVFETMKSASAALKGSEVLKSAGGRGDASVGGTAMDRIKKMASEIVQKSDKPMTEAQAIARVLDKNPELYDAYLNE